MSKGGATAPPSVNAGNLINQQGNANITAAEAQSGLNNAGTSGPLGASWWTPTSFDPGTGRPASWAQQQQLSALPQYAFNQQATLAGNLANNASFLGNTVSDSAQSGANLINQGLNTWGGQLPTSAVSTAGLPPLTGAAATGPIQNSLNFSGIAPISTDFGNLVTNAQNAAYNTQAGYLDPQFAQKHSDLAQQLADQGISAGSDAYSRAQGDLGRQETLAYQQAKDAAVAAGNQEQATLFGESLGARQQGVGEQEALGQFANQAQQQAFGQSLSNAALSNAANLQGFNEATTQWGEPFTALGSLLGGGQSLLGGAGNELAGLGSLGNFTWAGGLPSEGGSPSGVTPPNIGSLQSAANQGNINSFLAGNTLNNQLFTQLGGLSNALGGSNLLFGSGGLSGALGLNPSTGLFGSLGGLFGGGGAASVDLSPFLDLTGLPFAALA